MVQTLHEVFSRCQADIGDYTFEKIQRQEWLDFAEEALMNIAELSAIWIASATLPITTANSLSSLTISAANRPIRTYRVEINGKACKEYSPEAIANQIARRTVFLPNAVELSEYAFASDRKPTGDLVLEFAGQFQDPTTAQVSWYQKTPAETTFVTQTALPSKVAYQLRHILTAKAVERLLLKDPQYGQAYQMLQQKAAKAEREIQSFYTNLQDVSSISFVEPLRWLGE